tara:strand:+ start:664 stop:1179 length:516 start_codon:yes stop_codon:yes gene_type:complete
MSPKRTLGNITKYVSNLPIPKLDFKEIFKKIEEEKERPKLKVVDIINLSDKELERVYYYYGAGKAFLEMELSDIASKKALIEDVYKDTFADVSYKIVDRRAKEGLTKLNKEGLEGTAFAESEELREYKKQMREATGIFIRVQGELTSYDSMWKTLSRIIGLRTKDKKEYNI